MIGVSRVAVIIILLLVPAAAWATHPLITDDAETQGKGKFQLEINGQYDHGQELVAGASLKERGGKATSILTYGLAERSDIILTVPYQWDKVRVNDVTISDQKGISDSTLEVKWRFFDKEGLSLSLKPGLIIPTGNDDRSLGSGKVGYTSFFILTREREPWEFHLNLGYKRNENTSDQRKDIWHASVAAVREVSKKLKVVADSGIESNEDKSSNTSHAFLLGGVIYSVTENFDIDFGVKAGLNKAEIDHSLLAGITYKF
jgi:hypothetical protein